jgi:hypothetical protein
MRVSAVMCGAIAIGAAALVTPRALAAQHAAVTDPIVRAHALRPGAPVKMFVPTGSVRLVGWDRSTIEIRGTLSKAAQISLTGTDSGGLKLVIDEPVGRPASQGSRLLIRMPRGSQLSLKTVDATVEATDIGGWFYTVSGTLRIDGSMGTVDAEAMSGDIVVAATTPWARARTGAGHLLVSGAPEDVDASTIGGTLDVATSSILRGRFTSVTGDIRYASGFSPRSLFEFSDHSGTVELLLPRVVSARLELSSVEGTIDNGFAPLRPAAAGVHRLNVKLGGGGANVVVRTFRGEIRVRSR